MTDESKKIALQYFLGELNATTSPNNLVFNEYDKNNNQLQTKMANTYFPYGYKVRGIVQGNNSSGDGLEYSIVYGTYDNQNHTTTYGFMIILDEQYNVVQVIKKFSNNESFGTIVSLNVGNDGRFFMVEKDLSGYYRFVLLNNILAKSPNDEEYKVIMRQTYRFPDQSIISTTKMLITKHPQEARYLIAQLIHDYDMVEDYLYCIEFVINVGAENEWNTYSIMVETWVVYPEYQTNEIDDMLASWDSDNKLTFKVTLAELRPSLQVAYAEFVKTANSDTITDTIVFPEIATDYDYAQTIIKDFNVSYLSTSRVINNTRVYSIFKRENNAFQLVANYTNITLGTFKGIKLAKNKNDIFCTYQNNTITYVGIIVGQNIYLSGFTSFSSSSSDTLFFINIQKSYNLYTAYIQCGNYINFAKLIYLDEENNQSYIDINTLVPYYGTLYDYNNKLVFARTLYNKSISGQLTTSTIQVPNQFLNDITISNENLFGNTYFKICNNTQEFVKNEYEEVYVNFANSWNMQNHNNPNNIIFNVPGASRFNQSLTGTNDYELSMSIKYKINYDDDTYLIQTFDPTQITQIDNVAPWTHRFSWGIYNPTDKNILSIQIISADENTIYQTIDNLNFGSGKYYSLTQDVYVV